MRSILVSLAALSCLVVPGCDSRTAVECRASEECVQGGVDGTCTPSPASATAWCAYPDPGCDGSGQRWGVLAGDGLAETCVVDDTSGAPDGGFSIAISRSGDGGGTITSDPAGIDCGSTCSASFAPGTSVTLSAAADATSWFMGWSAAACAGAGRDTCTVATKSSVEARFEPHGKRLWAGHIGNKLDHANARSVTTDEAGATYVAGVSGAVEARYDGNIAITKIDADGDVLWTRFFLDPSGGESGARDVAYSPTDGSIVVSGWFAGTIDFDGTVIDPPSESLFLLKIEATTGQVRWVRHAAIRPRNNLPDARKPAQVAVDSSGQIVVATHFRQSFTLGGESFTPKGVDDIALLKYSADGQHLFTRVFGGTETDLPTDVGVDSAGGIYVTGTFAGAAVFATAGTRTATGGEDGFIMKTDPSGNVSWLRAFGFTGADAATTVTIDSKDRLFVGGRFTTEANLGGLDLTGVSQTGDGFLASYSGNGTHLWSFSINGNGSDSVVGICVNDDGDVALLGISELGVTIGSKSTEAAGQFLATISSAGQPLWLEPIGNFGGRALACHRSGLAVGGVFTGQLTVGDQVLTSMGQADMLWLSFVP